MKDLIRQILREETSGLTDGQIKSAYSLMNILTKGYQWYCTPYGIWLINPDTKQWMLELEESGELWYYIKTYDTFFKYLNMEESDFKSFIKIWVEDVLENGVASTTTRIPGLQYGVEDVLKNGVVSTWRTAAPQSPAVENALKNGIQLK